jgi:hypothetical protein
LIRRERGFERPPKLGDARVYAYGDRNVVPL